MSRTATRTATRRAMNDRRERTRAGRNRYIALAARIDRHNPPVPPSLPTFPRPTVSLPAGTGDPVTARRPPHPRRAPLRPPCTRSR